MAKAIDQKIQDRVIELRGQGKSYRHIAIQADQRGGGMIGYDCDGVLVPLKVSAPRLGSVIITGRTHDEWQRTLREVGSYGVPIYMRPHGKHGDAESAAIWKAFMILRLGVTTFYEDDETQADIIRRCCPDCRVVMVK